MGLLFHPLIRLGRHQAVELGVGREAVRERHKIAYAADQTAAGRYVRDVPQLRVRDVQQLCQLPAVGRALVQHDEKFRVCQHQPRRIGAQQLVG